MTLRLFLTGGIITLTVIMFHLPTQAQNVMLALGEYECTTDNDCEADEYCGIDDHVCKKLPTCNPDEICTEETCNPEEICPQPEDREGCDSNADCTDSSKPFCVNRSCVECTGDADCPQDPPRFCVENACRLGCTSNDDCTEEAAPRCNTEWGKCMPCPKDKPYLNKETWECSEVCETNAHCLDERRPFCRKENGAQLGTCGCPDKTTYSPEWQTCVYTLYKHFHGGKGRGNKGTVWSGGGNSTSTPFQDADYIGIWTDCAKVGYLHLQRNGVTIASTAADSFDYNLCNVYYQFPQGSTFAWTFANWKKKYDSYVTGTYVFIYKDRFKKLTGGTCSDDHPVMSPIGKCLACTNVGDGTTVNDSQSCYACGTTAPLYSAHSGKGKTDHVCRKCSSGNNWYYADQEQCLKCPNRFHRSNDTGCIDCAYTSGVTNVTKEECTRCPNRYWTETNTTTHLGTCYLCSTGSEVNNNGTACGVCTDENPIEKYNAVSNGCTNCEKLTTGTQVARNEECHKCGEGVWYAAKSSSTATNSYCRPCDMANNYYHADETECATCENTMWRPNDQICFDCDYTGGISNMTPETDTCSARALHNDNTSYPCTYGGDLTTTKTQCDRCDNRYWIENANGNGFGTCRSCPAGAKVLEDGLTCGCKTDEVILSDNRCFTCEQLSNGIYVNYSTDEIAKRCNACGYTYLDHYKRCYNCELSNGTLQITTKEECDACDNDRYWVETNATTHQGNCYVCHATTVSTEDGLGCECTSETPIARYNVNSEGCVDCKTLTNGTRVMSNEECHRCSRDLWYAGKSSQTATDSYCRPCDSGNNYYYSDRDECKTCSHTLWRSSDQYCFDCDYTGYIINLTEPEKKECRNRLTEKNTYSYPCTYGSNLTTTHEECLRCDNRYWTANTSNDGYGVCKVCTNGSAINNGTSCGCVGSDEVTTSADKCLTCDKLTEGTIGKTAEQCHKCSGWFATTENKCYKCDTQYVYNTTSDECHSCSAHLWRSSDGTCYACSYPYKMYDTTKAECERCSGRVWEEVSGGLGFCHPPVEE